MKTLGIGVDICENSRIKKLINNKLFLRRIFTNDEIIKSPDLRLNLKDFDNVVKLSSGKKKHILIQIK